LLKAKRKLFAVVVTFNRLDRLKNTVLSTLAENPMGLLVVNNASTDGTAQWLSQLVDDRLHVLSLPSNVGGAGGFHQGFKWVTENTDADWLVCYDDDAYPQPGAFRAFEQLDLPECTGGVAAAVYLPSGHIAEMNRPSVNPFVSARRFWSAAVAGRMGFHIPDEAYQGAALRKVEQSSFVGLFLDVEKIRNVWGYPEAELFIYADDVIYTHQISRGGHDILFAPTVRFAHDCVTLVDQRAVYTPLWKAYYTYRNGLKLYRIMSGGWFVLIAPAKVLVWLINARHYSDRSLYLRLTITAVWDGLRCNYKRPHAEVMALSKRT
jgi:GT2 family glycosyltransferase